MTIEYFEDHEKKLKQLLAISEVYCRTARFYNRLYKITGLALAKEMNQYYVEKGTKLLIGGLGLAIADMSILEKIIKELGE